MKTALITGANKSIGFETARQLLHQEFYVYLGCRDMKKGEQAASELHSEGLDNVESIEIDVDRINQSSTRTDWAKNKTARCLNKQCRHPRHHASDSP